jgi:hypothetical protein
MVTLPRSASHPISAFSGLLRCFILGDGHPGHPNRNGAPLNIATREEKLMCDLCQISSRLSRVSRGNKTLGQQQPYFMDFYGILIVKVC